jgi:hypothetical protein
MKNYTIQQWNGSEWSDARDGLSYEVYRFADAGRTGLVAADGALCAISRTTESLDLSAIRARLAPRARLTAMDQVRQWERQDRWLTLAVLVC